MDVLRDGLARQRLELVPGPRGEALAVALDLERPRVELACGVGPAESTGKSRVSYWPGRDAVGRPVLPAPVEAAGDDGHQLAASPATVSGTPAISAAGDSAPSAPTVQPNTRWASASIA